MGNVNDNGFIPLCIPQIEGNEWVYVKECLDTGWVSSVGAFVTRFERDVAARAGTKHAVATVNGTAALHIALRVAGVEPEDEVLVSALTFIAPANAIRYLGAWPVFMDADPAYWQMDSEKVADFLNHECRWLNNELRNKTTGRRVTAVLPVHILGHPVDMDPILEVAKKYNLAVIEDATESLGATYKGRAVGHLGDIACLSFNGNKIITTGGGGMILTDNEKWADYARYLTTQAKDDTIESVHHEVGYNYRLTNIQAAMGCAQLEKLGSFLERKRQTARSYRQALAGVPGITPQGEAAWACSAFWMFTILVDETAYRSTSRCLLRYLAENHIETRPLWQPLHASPAHTGSQAYRVAVAESLNRDGLSLPCSAGITPPEIARVAAYVRLGSGSLGNPRV